MSNFKINNILSGAFLLTVFGAIWFIGNQNSEIKATLNSIQGDLKERVFTLEDKYLTSCSTLYISEVGLINIVVAPINE